MPAISIIVPVYNAADTLQGCVDSIMAQSFSDWELLLVNDGSTDNSVEICQNLAIHDPRIIILSQNHQGVSAARNMALKHMKSPYVCFVDADDIIEPVYLHSLYQYKEYDMVICGYYVEKVSSDGTILKQEQHLPADIDIQVLEHREMLEPLFLAGMININCNKLLQSSIIKEHNLSYPDVPINEDYLLMVEYLEYCHNLKTVLKPLYHWQRICGKQTGVLSHPDNLVEIYNEAHRKTKKYFDSEQIAGRIMYYSYYFLVLKYYDEIHVQNIRHQYLNQLMSNSLVWKAFFYHHPTSIGEFILTTLLKFRCFRTFSFIHRKLIRS